MDKNHQPFFQYGGKYTTLEDNDGGEVAYEHYLVANAEGLAYLKDKIDEAIATGYHVRIDHSIVSDKSFEGVAIAEPNYREPRRATIYDRVKGFSCLALFASPVVLCFLGIWKLVDLIF